ncbi:hypothetical protein PMI36_04985 [Pseudomonas sp. GM79]|uniref:hypothetical protein n=1 Tax=Pseudomonas sp. GM79 TaxID=1144338 RepID=UPI00026F8E2D|nr:hypothetical protein [Pseudomonas sp. GM79]EJN19149.1 hypothetical protein PMI36_04985 [Pseudomonas sp. GM79]
MPNLDWDYYSETDRYYLQIKNSNQSAGTFDGRLVHRAGSEGVVDKDNKVEGGFSFYDDKQETVIWFDTPSDKWRLVAAYVNGSSNFDTWLAVRTSKSSNDTKSPERFTFKAKQVKAW